MGNYFFDQPKETYLDRVDGKAKVTGTAKYSAEYDIPGITYGVMVGSTITKGSIITLDTKAAEKAPGGRCLFRFSALGGLALHGLRRRTRCPRHGSR